MGCALAGGFASFGLRASRRAGRPQVMRYHMEGGAKGIDSMPVVTKRYRGTTKYFHVHGELVRAAQYRGLTTYQDVAVILALPLTGSYMGSETGHILGEISEDEVQAGRPMLSAVAVAVSGKPGPGFFGLARDLGKLRPGEDEQEFWVAEGERVYVAWKRPLRETESGAG